MLGVLAFSRISELETVGLSGSLLLSSCSHIFHRTQVLFLARANRPKNYKYCQRTLSTVNTRCTRPTPCEMALSDINQTLNDAAGKAQQSQGMSAETFLASLLASGAVALIGIVAFVALKGSLSHV